MSVTFKTTLGDIKIEVACGDVPKNAENFMAHCAAGNYKGSCFHRNIRGFCIQGGAPAGKMKGGKSIHGGYVDDEFVPSLRHDRRGVVAMANNGPNKNGSQFYIAYAAQAHLDSKSTVIGRVIDGLETLDAMERAPVEGAKFRPVTEIRITDVKIHANPIADAQG